MLPQTTSNMTDVRRPRRMTVRDEHTRKPTGQNEDENEDIMRVRMKMRVGTSMKTKMKTKMEIKIKMGMRMAMKFANEDDNEDDYAGNEVDGTAECVTLHAETLRTHTVKTNEDSKPQRLRKDSQNLHTHKPASVFCPGYRPYHPAILKRRMLQNAVSTM